MDNLHPDEDRVIYVAQGEIAIDDHPDTVLTTLLGSCVSVCLFDPHTNIGGMNHILLPHGNGEATGVNAAACHAMELLLNPMMKRGVRKERIQAKVFGGAAFSGAFGGIGSRNVDFVMDFLDAESIHCTGRSVGGRSARRIKFWPASGRVQQKLVREAPEMPEVTGFAGNGLELL